MGLYPVPSQRGPKQLPLSGSATSSLPILTRNHKSFILRGHRLSSSPLAPSQPPRTLPQQPGRTTGWAGLPLTQWARGASKGVGGTCLPEGCISILVSAGPPATSISRCLLPLSIWQPLARPPLQQKHTGSRTTLNLCTCIYFGGIF